MKSILDHLTAQALLLAPKIGVGLLVLATFWIIGSIIAKLLWQVGSKADPERQDAIRILSQVIKATLIVVGAISALGTLGVNVAAMVAGLGLTGFALGFALKDVLSNLLAGVLILSYRPFRRGDRIAVAGFEGTVIGIDLRYTILQGEQRQILIPNSVLLTNSISLDRLKAPGAGNATSATTLHIDATSSEPPAKPD